jgi:hypothetical protein
MARSARALVVELVADAKDFVKGTQQADDALEKFVTGADQDLDGLARDTDRATDKMGRSFDNLAREAKRSFDKVERSADDAADNLGKESFGEAGKESGSEFASNLGESISSGDYSALGRDTAAGLVSGFAAMPGLGPALAVVAAGAAALFGNIVKEAERRAAQVSSAFQRAAQDSLDALDLTERGHAFNTFIEQLGSGDPAKGMKEFNKQTKAAGVNITDVKQAFIAGGTPLQNLLTKLQQTATQADNVSRNAHTGTIRLSDTARAADTLASKLSNANKDLATGVELAGQLRSVNTSSDQARAIDARTKAFGQQANDLNSAARAQDRINGGFTDPRVIRAVDERTRALKLQSTYAQTASKVGAPGTVVGGKRLN